LDTIGRGCLGAIGGLVAAVVLTIVWGIFLVIALYSFAFALGSTETLRIGGITFLLSSSVVVLVHLGATTLLLCLVGNRWRISAVSAVIGNILAGSLTAATIATLLYILGDLPQTILNTVGLMLVLSAACPVALSLVIQRPVAQPGVVAVVVLATVLGASVLLFRTLYVPALIVLLAWVMFPALGGLLGGEASAVSFSRRVPSEHERAVAREP